jgi:hypothetical protein
MPIAQGKKLGAVIQKNDQNGQYANPVKLISSIWGNCTHLQPRNLVIFMGHQQAQFFRTFGQARHAVDV